MRLRLKLIAVEGRFPGKRPPLLDNAALRAETAHAVARAAFLSLREVRDGKLVGAPNPCVRVDRAR